MKTKTNTIILLKMCLCFVLGVMHSITNKNVSIICWVTMSERWIQPSGPANAKLLVCGRDCGYWEIQKLKGFVGPSGFYLDRALLEEATLPRSLVRVTNVVNCRPKADQWELHEPGAVARGLAELRSEIDRFAVSGGQLVLALGEQALQACVSGDPHRKPERKATITETRGYLFTDTWCSLPVLAAGHPAAFLHGGWIPGYPLFRWDVRKAGRYLRGERPPTDRREVFVTELDMLHEYVEKGIAAGFIALDIEEDRCLAFSHDATLGVAVPDYCREPMRGAVQELLDGVQGIVTQNGQYDITRLEQYGFVNPAAHWTDDVMLMWHAKEPLIAGKNEKGSSRTEKSLRFLASLLTWEPFYKDYNFEKPEDEWTLNAKDARVTLEIYEALSVTGTARARPVSPSMGLKPIAP